MKIDIADRWVAALLSGKYEQGKGLLRQRYENGAEEYCCLGVLCELYLADHPDSSLFPVLRPDLEVADSDNGNMYQYGECGELPPDEIQEWAGISSNSCSALSEENDTGKSFAQLADIIDEEAERL